MYLIFVSEILSPLKENAFTHGTGTDRLSVCSSRSGGAQCVPVSLQGHEGRTRSESGVGEQGFTTQAKFSRHSVALRKLYKANVSSLKGSIPPVSAGDNSSRSRQSHICQRNSAKQPLP